MKPEDWDLVIRPIFGFLLFNSFKLIIINMYD